MIFYRVKLEADQKLRNPKDNSIYVAHELYTEKEIEKFNLNKEYLVQVEVSRKATYREFLGRRFNLSSRERDIRRTLYNMGVKDIDYFDLYNISTINTCDGNPYQVLKRTAYVYDGHMYLEVVTGNRDVLKFRSWYDNYIQIEKW